MNYINDKLNGKYYKYYPNGNIKEEGEYFKGLHIGIYRKYFNNKNKYLEKEILFQEGNLVQTKVEYLLEDYLKTEKIEKEKKKEEKLKIALKNIKKYKDNINKTINKESTNNNIEFGY
jgi:antitoxin component YwqK of YwqJK toxin-antitoxin module